MRSVTGTFHDQAANLPFKLKTGKRHFANTA